MTRSRHKYSVRIRSRTRSIVEPPPAPDTFLVDEFYGPASRRFLPSRTSALLPTELVRPNWTESERNPLMVANTVDSEGPPNSWSTIEDAWTMLERLDQAVLRFRLLLPAATTSPKAVADVDVWMSLCEPPPPPPTARTPLGKRLRELSDRIAASGAHQLSWDELEQEVKDRRGEREGG